MILSRQWRERDLQRRLEVWGPRIGEEATTTHAQGMWWTQSSFFVVLLLIAICVPLEATQHTGAPIIIANLLIWPCFLYCTGKSASLRARAQRQATEAVATWERANVPVRSVEAFDRWAAQSQYYKFRNELDRQEP